MHVPDPFSLQVHPPPLQSVISHEPELLQSTVQSPPAHESFALPGPVDVMLHAPCTQVRVHDPDPLQRTLQPFPLHV